MRREIRKRQNVKGDVQKIKGGVQKMKGSTREITRYHFESPENTPEYPEYPVDTKDQRRYTKDQRRRTKDQRRRTKIKGGTLWIILDPPKNTPGAVYHEIEQHIIQILYIYQFVKIHYKLKFYHNFWRRCQETFSLNDHLRLQIP